VITIEAFSYASSMVFLFLIVLSPLGQGMNFDVDSFDFCSYFSWREGAFLFFLVSTEKIQSPALFYKPLSFFPPFFFPFSYLNYSSYLTTTPKNISQTLTILIR
jgi:hypothetical protein